MRKLLRQINTTLVVVLIILSFGYGNLLFSSEDIAAVKNRHETWIMNLPGVVGTAIGDCQGSPCIKVYIKEKNPELERQIPKQLEGFKLDIEVIGPIKILPN